MWRLLQSFTSSDWLIRVCLAMTSISGPLIANTIAANPVINGDGVDVCLALMPIIVTTKHDWHPTFDMPRIQKPSRPPLQTTTLGLCCVHMIHNVGTNRNDNAEKRKH